MRCYTSLRRRTDFARLRRSGRRFSTKSLVIYRSEPMAGDLSPMVGITVNKTIGKAVIRNKVRRRLAAIVDDALRSRAMRLLVVARPIAAQTAFADLHAEVTSALGRAY